LKLPRGWGKFLKTKEELKYNMKPNWNFLGGGGGGGGGGSKPNTFHGEDIDIHWNTTLQTSDKKKVPTFIFPL